MHTYIKKNVDVRPAGESSKQTEDTTSGTEGGQSHMTKPVEKKKNNTEKVAMEKPKKKQEKVPKVAVQQPVEAGSQFSPRKSKSVTSSNEDSCMLARLNNRGAKSKKVVE
ncbi:hypothetical protein F511_45869 [Dorcoceras hygrometricum]|uniref:Uncharacterized protein n=1 Tax=Dorcoceras hygrometricum TaxID=472368 RepID=A0A2Z6ZV00_9LAMI|nr:hypothetical protein F511_45869 [Dorcoceras hygrometricum]